MMDNLDVKRSSSASNPSHLRRALELGLWRHVPPVGGTGPRLGRPSIGTLVVLRRDGALRDLHPSVFYWGGTWNTSMLADPSA
jgi:hypothetical protein